MRAPRKLAAVVAALSVTALATATVAADGWQTTFDAAGWISYVGSTGDPDNPTSSVAHFEMDGDEITGVTIDAENQMVIGAITDLTVCEDAQCATSSNTRVVSVASYHAELVPSGIEVRSYTIPSAGGDVPAEAEVIYGDLTGTLNAEYESGYGETAGTFALDGSGSGEFACFAPMPGPLEPCIEGDGVLLPVGLDIQADGTFAVQVIGEGPGGASVFYSGDLLVDLVASADLDKVAREDPRAITATGSITVENATETFE